MLSTKTYFHPYDFILNLFDYLSGPLWGLPIGHLRFFVRPLKSNIGHHKSSLGSSRHPIGPKRFPESLKSPNTGLSQIRVCFCYLSWRLVSTFLIFSCLNWFEQEILQASSLRLSKELKKNYEDVSFNLLWLVQILDRSPHDLTDSLKTTLVPQRSQLVVYRSLLVLIVTLGPPRWLRVPKRPQKSNKGNTMSPISSHWFT